jgi:hypothetical protein
MIAPIARLEPRGSGLLLRSRNNRMAVAHFDTRQEARSTGAADLTYYRAAAFPEHLLTKSHSGREDEGAPMTQAEFHARAWKAARHKARALGWIV